MIDSEYDLKWKKDFLDAHNTIRKSLSLSLLLWDDQLEKDTLIHVHKMMDTKNFFHMVSLPFLQNIASGKKNLVEKPHKSIDLWMTDNHKLPIIDPNTKKIGASYSRNSNNDVYISCNYFLEI